MRRQHRAREPLAAAIALILLSATLLGAPARAETGVGAQDQAFWTSQQKLLDVVSDIRAAFGDDPDYIQPEIDLASGTVTVWWYGEAPMAALHEVAGQRARVLSRAYPYSRTTMEAAVVTIWELKDQLVKDQAFQLAHILGVSQDGSVVVEGDFTTSSRATTAESVGQVIQTHGGSRLTSGSVAAPRIAVKTGETSTTAASRGTDTSPFNAGAYFISSSGKSCSSGFGVTWNGYPRSMTARHCCAPAYRPREWADAPSNYTYKGEAFTDGSTGTTLRVSAGWNRAFVGPYNSTTYQSVKAVINVGLNAYVCTSGGNAGERCGIKITNMWVSFSDGMGPAFWTIQGQQTTAGAIATIQGDSGGPVITHYTSTTVGAVGIIQGLQNCRTTGCGSVRDGGGNKCGPTVLFTSVQSPLDNTGATLNIGP